MGGRGLLHPPDCFPLSAQQSTIRTMNALENNPSSMILSVDWAWNSVAKPNNHTIFNFHLIRGNLQGEKTGVLCSV